MTERTRGQRGETLVELLATLVLMSTAIIAVLGGIGVAITASDRNNKEVNSLSVVRNYAEAVAAAKYVPCATAASYAPPAVGYPVPTGYTAAVTGSVTYYDGTSSNPAVFGGSCPPDTGAQRMTIEVKSVDNRADRSLEIVKRGP